MSFYAKVKRPKFHGVQDEVEKEFRAIVIAMAKYYRRKGVLAGKAEELVEFHAKRAMQEFRRQTAERIRRQNALDAEEAFYRELRDGEQ